MCLELTFFGIISTLIFFGEEYYKYHGGKRKEQELEIYRYESVFLSKKSCVLLFEKDKHLLNRATSHNIYWDEGLVVLKGKNRVQDIKIWLTQFQQTVNKATGNQHLHFTAEIWTTDTSITLSEKECKFQVVMNN